jgi:hypothetical protein
VTPWAYVPAALLGSSLLGLGSLAWIASHDPSFSLEPDYYAKAVNWDQERAQWAENRRLGYELELSPIGGDSTLTVRLSSATGAPLSGAEVRADAFFNGRASKIHHVVWSERAPGIYVTALARAQAGLWEFRFTVRRGSERFTRVVRADVSGGSKP